MWIIIWCLGFIHKRQRIDNIILVPEVIHTSISNKEKGMVMKLDMANAFERDRHFFNDVLHQFGFTDSFIHWIQTCIRPL